MARLRVRAGGNHRKAWQPQNKIEKFGLEPPIRQPGQPAELVPVHVLLGHEASFVTGKVYG
ncbi:hypothetical protein PQR75_45625 [Paraburkholderia fungorum]|uniref:hypothetical protein n=1 Tax=Paraburkholderia TaxID=1822464 RepID=UPI0038BCE355